MASNMASNEDAHSEQRRIALLLARDGHAATREWVERTLNIYRQALAQPGSYAREPGYRAGFERSIREFEEWLASHP